MAEELKVRHGTCDLRAVTDDEEISVSVLGEDAGRTVSRLEVCQIIEARMRETFELLRNEMRATGHGMLPAGIVLTGGASQLAGAAELGREVLQMPVRVAGPSGVGGLVDTLLNPSLQHGGRAAAVGRFEPRRGRAHALRVGAGAGWPGPAPRRPPQHLPVAVGRCPSAPPDSPLSIGAARPASRGGGWGRPACGCGGVSIA